MAKFFALPMADTPDDLTAGQTFQIAPKNTWPVSAIPIYSTVFFHGPRFIQTDIQLPETLLHELGHAVDFALNGVASKSEDGDDYDILVRQSFFKLDYVNLVTARHPCTTMLQYLVDYSTGIAVCTDGKLNPIYARSTNSRIARRLVAKWFSKNGGDGRGWAGLFAECFAFKAYSFQVPPFLTVDPNGSWILQSGNFPCVLEYASQLVKGKIPPSVNCKIFIRPGYQLHSLDASIT